MKKLISLLLVLILCLSLCACGSVTAQVKTTTELSRLEKINQSKTINELYALTKGILPEDETTAALNKWKELFPTVINGFYYNKEHMTNWLEFQIGLHEDGYYKLEDSRAVYMKSVDEVYFAPYSEAQLKEKGLTLEDIANMKNSKMYCYRITKFDDFTVDLESVYLKDKTADKDFKNLHLWWNVADDYVRIRGWFLDECREKGKYDSKDDSQVEACDRNYFTSEEKALEYKNAKEAERVQKEIEKNALKNSPPKIGMTADEVKKSKWGHPNKINRDTYSWGTSEQWVYNSYGYVYFENGIVTAIQER